MSVDVETRVAPGWLTLRLAAAVIAGGGRLPCESATEIARETMSSGKRPLWFASEALRPLVEDDVLVNIEGAWYAPNLADLAAWLADGVEAREDAGLLTNPTIPAPRSGDRQAA